MIFWINYEKNITLDLDDEDIKKRNWQMSEDILPVDDDKKEDELLKLAEENLKKWEASSRTAEVVHEQIKKEGKLWAKAFF